MENKNREHPHAAPERGCARARGLFQRAGDVKGALFLLIPPPSKAKLGFGAKSHLKSGGWVVNWDRVKTWEIMPFLLLLLFSLALSVGTAVVVLVLRRGAAKPEASPPRPASALNPESLCAFRRPNRWLVVKSRSLLAVQSALGLLNPQPCSLLEGLFDEERLFIAPPIKGWILIIGSGLPDPSDDVDACFRFILDLSRKVGQVHYFSVNRVLLDHAWVQADRGRVLRAYAWAGKTLWNQGHLTRAEKELELRCFNYGEAGQPPLLGRADAVSANLEKVPQLAARWSLDPAHIEARLFEKAQGIAGELARRY